jgi:hypothetical protein
MSVEFESPAQIVATYENGLPGWQYNPETMDRLFADQKVQLFSEAAAHLAGVGKGKMALLWRSREMYDPGAFGQEPQVRGSCVSHGSRNARDTTRAVEIHIKGEAEEYYKRGATEPTYAARGSYGEGMDPAVATRFETDVGFLFRQKYPFGDLTRLNEGDLVDRWTGRMPDEVKAECRKCHVGRWIAPTTVDQAKDLLFSGYAMHSGQNFGVAANSDSRGIAVPSGAWSHDMATVGFDDSREIYPVGVFLIANSWAAWNSKPRVWPEDRYGPWPVGSFWVSEAVYADYFVGSQSIFAFCDVVGVPQKKLPDYGNLTNILG